MDDLAIVAVALRPQKPVAEWLEHNAVPSTLEGHMVGKGSTSVSER